MNKSLVPKTYKLKFWYPNMLVLCDGICPLGRPTGTLLCVPVECDDVERTCSIIVRADNYFRSPEIIHRVVVNVCVDSLMVPVTELGSHDDLVEQHEADFFFVIFHIHHASSRRSTKVRPKTIGGYPVARYVIAVTCNQLCTLLACSVEKLSLCDDVCTALSLQAVQALLVKFLKSGIVNDIHPQDAAVGIALPYLCRDLVVPFVAHAHARQRRHV